MAELFDVQSSTKGAKAERMLTGSRTTEIRSKGAIYKVNVVETYDYNNNIKDCNNGFDGFGNNEEVAKKAQIDLQSIIIIIIFNRKSRTIFNVFSIKSPSCNTII